MCYIEVQSSVSNYSWHTNLTPVVLLHWYKDGIRLLLWLLTWVYLKCWALMFVTTVSWFWNLCRERGSDQPQHQAHNLHSRQGSLRSADGVWSHSNNDEQCLNHDIKLLRNAKSPPSFRFKGLTPVPPLIRGWITTNHYLSSEWVVLCASEAHYWALEDESLLHPLQCHAYLCGMRQEAAVTLIHHTLQYSHVAFSFQILLKEKPKVLQADLFLNIKQY